MSNQFKILKNAKKFSKSSQKWLRRQINDPFVVKAKTEGWRSRSAFKIIEIDKKFNLVKLVSGDKMSNMSEMTRYYRASRSLVQDYVDADI